MTTTTISSSTQVLADLFPRRDSRSRAITQDAVLVIGFALLTALAAQIEIPLGFTPVPLTGQTFAVLLSGAVLGMRRGALSQLTYWFAGLVGLPFYSGGAGGWERELAQPWVTSWASLLQQAQLATWQKRSMIAILQRRFRQCCLVPPSSTHSAQHGYPFI